MKESEDFAMMTFDNYGNPATESLDRDTQMRPETDPSCNCGAEGAVQRAPPREKPGDHRLKVRRRDGEEVEIPSGEAPAIENGLTTRLMSGLRLMGLKEELSLLTV